MLNVFKDHEIAGKTAGIIFDIKRFAIHDGKGIRTTVFFKGCPLRCRWCHNPESQEKEPEKIPGRETIGKRVPVDYVINEIEKDTVFYDESGGGVTFSGGEPLMQPDFLLALLVECRNRAIHTILDTSGYAVPQVLNSISDKVDLFFYDLKLMDNERHIAYTGVPNRSILENLKMLARQDKNIVIRFPVIPGITDDAENINALAEFVLSLKEIDNIHLLPFHRTAQEKYKRLERQNLLKEFQPPTEERMAEIETYFKSRGFKVKIGG
ncbi:MAG: glycyl-radical enzyme activating protein [Candidatus Aminicenantes bacterium]|nr:glycyl-radical enzyme activating protein [Candidatus Aminicenantes bacterium]